MFTTAFRDQILELLDSHFCGLLTAITDIRAGTVTEATYTGYDADDRPPITFGAPGATSPVGGRQVANSGAVTFPANGGSNQDMIGFAVYSAATGGTIKDIGFLDADPPVIGTATAGDDLITAPAHGLATDQRVFVMASPGALLPAGLSENTAYFVLAAGLTADKFALSTTSGGAAANITADGAGMFIPYTAVTVAAGATPTFAIGALVVQL